MNPSNLISCIYCSENIYKHCQLSEVCSMLFQKVCWTMFGFRQIVLAEFTVRNKQPRTKTNNWTRKTAIKACLLSVYVIYQHLTLKKSEVHVCVFTLQYTWRFLSICSFLSNASYCSVWAKCHCDWQFYMALNKKWNGKPYIKLPVSSYFFFSTIPTNPSKSHTDREQQDTFVETRASEIHEHLYGDRMTEMCADKEIFADL